MGTVAPGDPKLTTLFHSAMEIWLKALPDIPLVQFYHRNPGQHDLLDQLPDATNPYINSANWHRTCELVLLGIKSAAA